MLGLQEFGYFRAIETHDIANCFDFGPALQNSTLWSNWVCLGLTLNSAYDRHLRYIFDSLDICAFFCRKLRWPVSESIWFVNSNFFSFAS
jgi:hypothetical protein